MPSYRVALTVGLLRPVVEPAAVLPAATAAARERTDVEAYDVDVVRGRARVTVRFTSDDDAGALDVGRRVRATVTSLAEVDDPVLARRYGARWYRVAAFGPSY